MSTERNHYTEAAILAVKAGGKYKELVEEIDRRLKAVDYAKMIDDVSNASVTKVCKKINELDAFYFEQTGEHFGRVWNRTDKADMLSYIREVQEAFTSELKYYM